MSPSPVPEVPPARKVECPACGAGAGQKCRIHGTELEATHAARARSLEELNADRKIIR